MFFNKKPLLEVDSYTYLGITLKKNGNFNLAVNVLNSKALKAQFAIRQGFYNMPVKVQLKVYDSLVKPISLYGSEIWGAYIYNWNFRFQISDFFISHHPYLGILR